MTPFVFLMFVALLITCGVAMNLYLYSRGVFRGGRYRGLQRLHPATARTMSNETIVGGQFYRTFEADQTSRMVGTMFFIMLAVLLAVVFLGTAALSLLVH